jgi:integrase/recombinase XerD
MSRRNVTRASERSRALTELVVGQPVGGELVNIDAAYDFTEAWLANRRFSENTRDGYRRDIHQWLQWCAQRGLDPLEATFLDVNAWGRELEEPADDRKALASASIARKMSAVSSWYTFIVKLGKMPANPAAIADRPPVDRDFSTTASFTRDDAEAMLGCASYDDPYLGVFAPLLAAWMVYMGTRASETVHLLVSDLGHHEGHRVVTLTLKGGRRQLRPLPVPLAEKLDLHLAGLAGRYQRSVEELTGPLFINRRGDHLDRHDLARFVKRLAKEAGVRNAGKISPHSFRHAWNSMARAAGAGLEDRQDAMGHRDPRTTRRYDRAGRSLLHDPAHEVAKALAPRREQADAE